MAQAWPLASPLLTDSIAAFVSALRHLATVPAATLSPADGERLERAAEEFIAAQRFNADRPEARSALGSFLRRRGQPVAAETEYKAALRLSAQYVPAAINLADLFRQLGRESEGESVLRTALITSARDAGLHYSLGLTLVRLKRSDDAIEELGIAAALEPDRARYAYVYAVALHSAGVQQSISVQTESCPTSERPRYLVGPHQLLSGNWRCRIGPCCCRAIRFGRARRPEPSSTDPGTEAAG